MRNPCGPVPATAEPFACIAMPALERFRAKWAPVRVKKTRQNKNLEPSFRFNRNGKGSSWPRRLDRNGYPAQYDVGDQVTGSIG